MENVCAMPKKDQVLAEWIAHELRRLRENYCRAHKISSVEEFAKHVGVTRRHIYALENSANSPKVDTLAQLLKACDSNLAKFCEVLVTHMELSAIKKDSEEERGLFRSLARGLSNPKTLRVLKDAASNVSELLELLDSKSVR